MLVYRIEHRISKYGPFCGRDYDPGILLRGVGRCLEPSEDGITRFYYGVHICAVKNLEGILQWFQNCLRTLSRYNYLVRVYEADDNFVEHGGTQLVFAKEYAYVVEEIELLDIRDKLMDIRDNVREFLT